MFGEGWEQLDGLLPLVTDFANHTAIYLHWIHLFALVAKYFTFVYSGMTSASMAARIAPPQREKNVPR
jgi:hypothetical protein